MSATTTVAAPRAFRLAWATIAGETSHAVTSYPRSSIGSKLFPVPQATSRSRLPRSPAAIAHSSMPASQRSCA